MSNKSIYFQVLTEPFIFWEMMSVITVIIWDKQVSYFPSPYEHCNILTDYVVVIANISFSSIFQKLNWVVHIVESNAILNYSYCNSTHCPEERR